MTDIDMNEDIQRGIEESRKINTIIEDVKVPGGLDKIRKLFGRKKIPSDIPVLSEFVQEYFEPAQKMHERGDYSGAVHVYERAVSKGSQLGCFVLSQYYLHGLGVEKDLGKYLSLLEEGGVIRDGCVSSVYRVLVNEGFSETVELNLHCVYDIE